jgi:hypothetical protein
MRPLLAPLLALALLAGCAPKSPDQLSDETVQIIPTGRGEFLAMFLNRDTLMFNGDLAADRMRIIAARLQSAGCRDPRMLGEHAEEQPGTWSFGRKKIVYNSEWRCF